MAKKSRLSGFAQSIHSAITQLPSEEQHPGPPRWIVMSFALLAMVGIFTPVIGAVICAVVAGQWFMQKLERREYPGAVALTLYLAAVITLGLLDALNFYWQRDTALIEHIAYSVFFTITLAVLFFVRKPR
jgi:FtsH-binding integral membrane protein